MTALPPAFWGQDAKCVRARSRARGQLSGSSWALCRAALTRRRVLRSMPAAWRASSVLDAPLWPWARISFSLVPPSAPQFLGKGAMRGTREWAEGAHKVWLCFGGAESEERCENPQASLTDSQPKCRKGWDSMMATSPIWPFWRKRTGRGEASWVRKAQTTQNGTRNGSPCCRIWCFISRASPAHVPPDCTCWRDASVTGLRHRNRLCQRRNA